jgi:hypothetical protein
MADKSLLAVAASKQHIAKHRHGASQEQPNVVVDEHDELKRRLEDLPPEFYKMIYYFTFTYYLPPRAPDEVIHKFRFAVQFQINQQIRHRACSVLLRGVAEDELVRQVKNLDTSVFAWWVLSFYFMMYLRKHDLKEQYDRWGLKGKKRATLEACYKAGQPFSLQDWKSSQASDAEAFCCDSWVLQWTID